MDIHNRHISCSCGAMAFATLRGFQHHRTESALAVFALAAGIGFSTTLFSIVKAVNFSEPPLPESSQLLRIQTSPNDVNAFAAQQTTCEGVAGVVTMGANVEAAGSLRRMRVAYVSPDFFEILHVTPAVGSGLQTRGAVVIGDRLWRENFEASPDVAGQTLLLNGQIRFIAGVMPATFVFPRAEQVWAAWEYSNEHAIAPEGRGSDAFLLARLRRPHTVDEARSEMNLIWRRLTAARTNEPVHGEIDVVRYADINVKGDIKVLLANVLCACFCVLLIACADVAHLHLARAVRRMTEFAVRSALGASRRQLVFGLLKESLVLSAAGAAGGILFSVFALRLFANTVAREALLTQSDRPWVRFELDTSVLFFVATLTVVAAVAAGLFPALRVSGMNLEGVLRDSGGTTSLRAGRFGRALVHVQLAGAVLLLIGAGLVSTVALRFGHRLPFDPDRIATARMTLNSRDYPSALSRIRFFEQVRAGAARSPGVLGAAITNAEDLNRAPGTVLETEDRKAQRSSDLTQAQWQSISPDYFEVWSSPLLEGRLFTAHDDASAPPVAIVNLSLARRLWPGISPMGKRLRARSGPFANQWLLVVGVAPASGSLRMDRTEQEPGLYVPLRQAPAETMSVLLHTRSGALAAIPALRETVRGIDPNIPLYQIFTAAEIIDIGGIGLKIPMAMFAACGVFAMLLGSLGAWGVLSLVARQRTREIGIRLALGATPRAVLSLMLRDGGKQVAGGVGIGALLGLILNRVLASLFGAFEHEWMVFGAVILLVSAVSFAALWGPSHAASKVSPLKALRAQS